MSIWLQYFHIRVPMLFHILQGFICIFSVTNGSAADRAGLRQVCEQATSSGHLVVMVRLEGKSLLPSSVSSLGLLHCCDHTEVKETLATAIDQMDRIQLYIMAWPGLRDDSHHPSTQSVGLVALRPPENSFPGEFPLARTAL